MKNKLILFIILFILFKSTSQALTESPFKNLVILNEPKQYKEINFQDYDGNFLSLSDFKSKVYILNFWAVWCSPCRKEMPSLDQLENIKDLKIFPLNIETRNKKKSKTFFKELQISNLSIYFDVDSKLANLFKLRGVPTTIILNEKRYEVARILGEFDFSDEKFANWIKKVNNYDN